MKMKKSLVFGILLSICMTIPTMADTSNSGIVIEPISSLQEQLEEMTEEQKASFMSKLTRLLGNRISDVKAKTQEKPGWTQIVSTEKYKDKSIHISSKEMSDGMLRLLAFVAISEIKSSNATMLLDEIENGVNTNYTEKLLEILKEMYAEKRHQLILTTHSTVFMR